MDAREALERYAAETLTSPALRHDECAPPAFDALREVLDLHQPYDSEFGNDWCTLDHDDYPCPTVKAITAKLAGER